ncbi:MAG: recombinase family protein [Faecalicatena sp.]|uniref:recombinase family protein n=1 Tax=Faecalicatena sp. TaxID=2005360 RepID=UPI002587805E|nr:recombinase family protein [Faecalicatena sp.]MCI6468107.1 recombinase family protein [Faecalicatena sp.]MDY4670923.1 recombinase family protein [Oliverpabstia sp.]MDY5620360.1 recombinase family protein [Lachnospiraceae bacterium]
MKFKEMKLVAIYIRVSTLDQAREGYSLEAQEKTLRKWCQDHGYEVYDLYADRGISGKDIDHRPDMRRLLADAKNNCFDVVIFWALSRFTRSVSDLYDTMSLLQKHNISMVSYTESFDTSTPMGRAMIGIVGVFAQLEREITGERVLFAMQERAAQGKRTCSEVLGYSPSGKDTFEVNLKEAEYVKFAFDKYLERKSLSEVAKLCRDHGYRGKRGKVPAAYSIYVILTRPIYCGYNTFCGQLYKGSHEPIIDTDTYKRVQRLLKKQGKLVGRTNKHIQPSLF